MKHKSQTARFQNYGTSGRKFYLFMGLMTFLGLGALSAKQAKDAQTGVPVFKITPVNSLVKFDVEASVAIEGKFDKWDATLTFTSTDLSTGVFDVKIDAASIDTGSGMKNGKLKLETFRATRSGNSQGFA